MGKPMIADKKHASFKTWPKSLKDRIMLHQYPSMPNGG
jgi:hypothetical protein